VNLLTSGVGRRDDNGADLADRDPGAYAIALSVRREASHCSSFSSSSMVPGIVMANALLPHHVFAGC